MAPFGAQFRACFVPQCPALSMCNKARAVLNGKKKVFQNQFSQKSPRALHVLNHGWWRLAVGSWQLAVGGGWWWLAAVGGW